MTAPVITTHPSDASVTTGDTATFTVVATGDSLTYQWFRANPVTQLTDGGDLFGSNSETLLILNVMEASEGDMYYIEVTNGAGTVPSNMATLSICKLNRVSYRQGDQKLPWKKVGT